MASTVGFEPWRSGRMAVSDRGCPTGIAQAPGYGRAGNLGLCRRHSSPGSGHDQGGGIAYPGSGHRCSDGQPVPVDCEQAGAADEEGSD